MTIQRATDQTLNASVATKSGKTRERILDATAMVLSRKGYAGTRLSDVAEAAELQAPAIYYYFQSREEMIEEVMWAGMARIRRHVEETVAGLPASTPPLEKIMAAVEAHLLFELAISDYTTAAIRNAAQLPETIRARQAEESNEYGKLWRQLFTESRDAGQLREGLDDHIGRMLVMGALNWAAEWWSERVGTYEQLVAQAQDFVRRGISA